MNGRVSVFVETEKRSPGGPDLSGKVTMDNGDVLFIDLWKEAANTKVGYMYKGRVKPAPAPVQSFEKKEDF